MQVQACSLYACIYMLPLYGHHLAGIQPKDLDCTGQSHFAVVMVADINISEVTKNNIAFNGSLLNHGHPHGIVD